MNIELNLLPLALTTVLSFKNIDQFKKITQWYKSNVMCS